MMASEFLQDIEETILTADKIAARSRQIHAAILNESKYIDAPNFRQFHPDDLESLFDKYDRLYFAGQIRKAVGTAPLHFSLSKRMTSAGGKTVCTVDRRSGKRSYEVGVSTTILFGCFGGDDHRPLTASGIVCHNRLEALQRIMEHEMVHLIEFLLWNRSSCSQSRFHSITRRFFGHTENKHQLITPREKARVQFGIQPGSAVRFRFDGVEHQGVVNRISKRATVLVEDNEGERYTNGKYYTKFYVPIKLLTKTD